MEFKITVRSFVEQIVYCPNPNCRYKTIFDEPTYKEIECPACHKSAVYDIDHRDRAIG
jgi:transcription initiation factor IIE alpha subunit